MHQAFALEHGLAVVCLLFTRKKARWPDELRTGKQACSIASIDMHAPFFSRFQSNPRPGAPVMYHAACREAQCDFAQWRILV